MAISRRNGIAVMVAAAAVARVPSEAVASAEPRRTKIGTVAQLREHGTVSFNYVSSPALAILLSDGRIVAFSVSCTHLGCPVDYERAGEELVCPCHQSRFAANLRGRVVGGPAPRPRPQIVGVVAANGDVFAPGVDAPLFGQNATRSAIRAVYEAEGR